MKSIGRTLKYKGKEYDVVFTLNVMEAIQEEYGTLEKWADLTEGGEDGEPNAKAVIFGFTEMLNEGIDIKNEETGSSEKPLTRKQVGRILTEVGMAEIASTMQEVVVESTKSGENSKNE